MSNTQNSIKLECNINDYQINGYKCYKKSRESGRGGGVMLYVDEELESYECDWLSEFGESCWCYIKIGRDKVLVG